MTHVIYKFEIPDPTRPIAGEQGLGPSGELMPFVPAPLRPEDVIGRSVAEVCTFVGTYGMGGPGFFGLRLGDEWLVVSIWGASEWMHVNGRLVQDHFGPQYGRRDAWISEDRDDLSPRLVGSAINGMDIREHSFEVLFSNGDVLRIEEAHEGRPILEGSKEPRAFAAEDDLRRAVFLSPTAELWV